MAYVRLKVSLPEEDVAEIRAMAERESRQSGTRPSIASIVRQALREFLRRGRKER